jgi:hypothetical protein
VEGIVLIACWSVKGGSGVSVVALALAELQGRRTGSALLVDLGGDQPAIAAIAEPTGPGVAEMVALGPALRTDAVGRLAVPLDEHVDLLPRGPGALGDDLAALLAVLALEARPVIVDCGVALDGPARTVAAAASRSLLVLRSCFLSLRAASRATLRPSGVVLVREPTRALGPSDVADVLSVPVVADVVVDPTVARAVDAGLFLARVPGPLHRSLRAAA